MDRREAIKRTALLTGFAVSGSFVSAVLQGCQPEAKSLLAEWTPLFFAKEDGLRLAEIAERILPRTDTPGAQDVFVHEFVDLFVNDCLEAELQQRFREGFAQLLADCQQAHGRPFDECSPQEQLAFLNAQDETVVAYAQENPDLQIEDYPFFLTLKQLILLGYFTSEKVCTEVLAYLPVPGKYEPCMPYEEGMPVWATGGRY